MGEASAVPSYLADPESAAHVKLDCPSISQDREPKYFQYNNVSAIYSARLIQPTMFYETIIRNLDLPAFLQVT